MTPVSATDALAQLRLMQLVSPSLPVGAYSYSQGLEWAVQAGWVHNEETFTDWLQGLVTDSLTFLELPVLLRLRQSCNNDNIAAFIRWGDRLLASRETREQRDEERNRARALCRLLVDLDCVNAEQWRDSLRTCQAAPFALATRHWNISISNMLLGYAWGWLENQTAAGIKLIPLGQTAGQRVLQQLSPAIVNAAHIAMTVDDGQIGACAPAQALASSQHETQYSRLFRS